MISIPKHDRVVEIWHLPFADMGSARIKSIPNTLFVQRDAKAIRNGACQFLCSLLHTRTMSSKRSAVT
jgi:hypothetical protein